MSTSVPVRFFFLVLATVTALAACKKEDDADAPTPTPQPVDPRAAFLGSYQVTDSLWIFGSFAEAEDYALSITTGGTASDTLYFNNLWNDGASYYALLAGDLFSFPSQNVSGPYDMSGSGTFNGDQLQYETSGDAFVHRGHGLRQ